jgi:hypothetical protein
MSDSDRNVNINNINYNTARVIYMYTDWQLVPHYLVLLYFCTTGKHPLLTSLTLLVRITLSAYARLGPRHFAVAWCRSRLSNIIARLLRYPTASVLVNSHLTLTTPSISSSQI